MRTNNFRPDARLRRTERLQTSSDFQRVFERGRFFWTEAIRIHYLKTDRELSRLGLVVSRRRGKAHVRVRIRRLLRDVFRSAKRYLPRSYDIVLIPRGSARSRAEYEQAMKTFLDDVRVPRKETRGRRRAPGAAAAPGASAASRRPPSPSA